MIRLRLFFAPLLWVASSLAAAADHGVILLYHHVSESTPGSTSISPARFEQHLQFIEDEGYEVIALSDMLQSIYGGEELPEKSVAITFDDAYLSVYENAFVLLKQRGWPFTLFVATEPLDSQFSDFFSWSQLREMLDQGGEVGGHSVSHAFLARRPETQSPSAWIEQVAYEIDESLARIEAETGVRPVSFAYPYGESTAEIQWMLADRGLYGLLQQSGAAGSIHSPQAIPRFPLGTANADLTRLRLALRSQPLPVIASRWTPESVDSTAPRALHFDLLAGGYRLAQLACYTGAGEPLEVIWYETGYGLDVPPSAPGRNKINCTAPSTSEAGSFYWYSWMWLAKTGSGAWPAE